MSVVASIYIGGVCERIVSVPLFNSTKNDFGVNHKYVWNSTTLTYICTSTIGFYRSKAVSYETRDVDNVVRRRFWEEDEAVCICVEPTTVYITDPEVRYTVYEPIGHVGENVRGWTPIFFKYMYQETIAQSNTWLYVRKQYTCHIHFIKQDMCWFYE